MILAWFLVEAKTTGSSSPPAVGFVDTLDDILDRSSDMDLLVVQLMGLIEETVKRIIPLKKKKKKKGATEK
jgi:hypothetical protein